MWLVVVEACRTLVARWGGFGVFSREYWLVSGGIDCFWGVCALAGFWGFWGGLAGVGSVFM